MLCLGTPAAAAGEGRAAGPAVGETAAGGAGMRLISSSKQKYMQPMEGATCRWGGSGAMPQAG